MVFIEMRKMRLSAQRVVALLQLWEDVNSPGMILRPSKARKLNVRNI